MPDERPLHLDAESLLSKWGFHDGLALRDWWWDTYDEPPPANEDDILHALAAEYLMPQLRAAGHTGELVRIETSHNPVRLDTLDGQPVDHYDPTFREFDPPIHVEITRADVEHIINALTITEQKAGSNDPPQADGRPSRQPID